jgi:hypothetical protein
MQFIKRSEPKPGPLDVVIEEHASRLRNIPIASEEYAAAVASLKVLCDAKAALPRPNVISADTAISAATNLVGIFAILGHERANVITSKALGFIWKPKS